MTDRPTFDPFEQRIAAEFERYVQPVADPKPISAIAEAALRPRGLGARARNLSRPRRFLLLGLAAAFLVPATYLGAASLRPPTPDLNNQVEPPQTDHPQQTSGPSTSLAQHDVSIFVRRDGSLPGVSIVAVRPDGAETVVRHVPDSVVPGGGTVSESGAVSQSGWLALESSSSGGPMIIIDLRREDATPWLVDRANTVGFEGDGPRWGPTGLVAADAGSGDGRVVIADPETRTTRIVSMPDHNSWTVWTADGSGIVGRVRGSAGGLEGKRAYQTVPIDGGDPRSGVGEVFDPRGAYGPDMAVLRICSGDQTCPGGDDGRVERIEPDGSARTVWRQTGVDRVLGAAFGRRADEYWLTLDHDTGRQVTLVHVESGQETVVSTFNRDRYWQDIGDPLDAADDSSGLVWFQARGEAAAVVMPFGGAPATFHTGQFAGFVDGAAAAAFATGLYQDPAETMPALGEAYVLPTLEELIALDPRETAVVGTGSHDAIAGDPSVHTFEVSQDRPSPSPGDSNVQGEADFDCHGPSSVTISVGAGWAINPCIGGRISVPIGDGEKVTFTASADTSWRVVIYPP